MAESILAPYNLGRLNPLGLNSAAPALFAYGTEEQRLRFLPPLVRNEEKWCQLLSEPGAGSDLASLATRAVRDGEEWVLNGQKVWTTWAHLSDFAICLARTDPAVPKRRGLTYFIVDLHAPGVEVRPLRHIGGEVDFNEVFLDDVRVPDAHRIGATGDGWRVAGLDARRRAPDGVGFGLRRRRPDRRFGHRPDHPARGGARADVGTARPPGADAALQRGAHPRLDEPARARVGARRRHAGAGRLDRQGAPGQSQPAAPACSRPTCSVPVRVAWDGPGRDLDAWAEAMPFESRAMLRSRANTIEGGTTEVNKNIVAERVLGLPREPDPYVDAPWEAVPRS